MSSLMCAQTGGPHATIRRILAPWDGSRAEVVK